MNSGGLQIATSRFGAFTCLIMPFADRLDVQLPYLFYPTTLDADGGPTTVFTDRFWDDQEHWIPPGVGVVPNSSKPYLGPVPPPGIRGPLQGTPDEWLNGLDFGVWQAGGYEDAIGCWPLTGRWVWERVVDPIDGWNR